MSTTNFQDGRTPIVADWLNDVDAHVYDQDAVAHQASNINYTPDGTGAIARSVETKLRETVSAFDFMTLAQITDAQAYAYGLDLTTALQNAIDAAFAAKQDLFVPSGGYLVTGLTLPGNYPAVDQRDEAFRIFGQGYGIAFSNLNTGGTVFKSITNTPVLSDRVIPAPNAHANYEIDHIRFDGTSTTPVVLLNGFYGQSSFHNNVIYQRGTGDGLKIIYGATAHIYENYAFNKDYVATGLGASRTGIGFNFPLSYDSGLLTFTKNTSRGWLTGYSIGGGSGAPISVKVQDCESSTVYNGLVIGSTANKAMVIGHYMEGGEGGIGISNSGSYTSIRDCLIFPGFAKGIEDTSTTNIGTCIESNIISLGAVVNAIGIDVQSSAAYGGNSKYVAGNMLVYTAGTNGVNGIKISGTDPRVNLVGNGFQPRSAWTGTSTLKINDASSNGVYGLTTKASGNFEIPVLSGGAFFLFDGSSALTQADVSGNTLTLPDIGNYFVCSATGAATVQIISAGVTSGRLVTFRTTTANMTFTNTAYIKLAGAVSFSGPGTITFMVERVGANNYAYEMSRTVF